MVRDGVLLIGLDVLDRVAELRNLTEAGEALGMTASGVSRSISRLEARLGVRLFDRSPRGVVPTAEGRRLLERTQPLLHELENALTDTSSAAGAIEGCLRVNVNSWFARLVLAPRLNEFLEAWPKLDVELRMSDGLPASSSEEERWDVAIRFGEPQPSSLIARKLLETRILTCAAPSYLARHGTPRRPSELARHHCILYRDPATGRPFAWELHRAGKIVKVRVSGRVTFDEPTTAVAATLAGLGVTQAMQLGTERLFARGELVHLLPAWSDEPWPLYAYHRSRRLPPPKVRAFLDFAVRISSEASAMKRPSI